MIEPIDILTKTGKPIGRIAPKAEVHHNGHYHNTAHIWFYNRVGQILLQQRSAKKTIFPLLWDVSVAGHVDAGESIKQAAIRETREEIGAYITESDLKKIGIFECFKTYPNGIIDNEFHHTFIVETNLDITDFVAQQEEVEALKFVSFAEFNDILKNIGKGNHFVPSNKTYYEFVLSFIQNEL